MIRRLLGAILALALTAGLLGTTAALGLDALVRTGFWRGAYGSGDPLVILVIGSDQGPPIRPGNPAEGLADGIHLLVVDTAGRRMTVVDIPRDSAIGGRKINAALAAGGPTQLEGELEAWTGLAIDFWVLASFQSVASVVESMGGTVEIDVPQAMVDPYSGSDLQPGRQAVGPGQALAFARNRRSLADGDIGRTRNQTVLMLSALAQLQRTPDDTAQLLRVIAQLHRYTASNIPPGELLPLALLAMSIPLDRIAHETIRGPFGSIGPASVIIPQPGDLFERLRGGQIGPAQ